MESLHAVVLPAPTTPASCKVSNYSSVGLTGGLPNFHVAVVLPLAKLALLELFEFGEGFIVRSFPLIILLCERFVQGKGSRLPKLL